MIRFENWKILVVLGVCLVTFLFSAPNVLPDGALAKLPGWVPRERISLGLDLRGGSHVLFAVDVAAVIKERHDQLIEDVRSSLREAKIAYTGGPAVKDGAVVLQIRDGAQIEAAKAKLQALVTPIQSASFGLGGRPDLDVQVSPDGAASLKPTPEWADQRIAAAVAESIEIVRRRIDATGVREPTIQRQGKDLIVVQLPGVSDPQRIIEIIGKTAKLTFRMVDEDADWAAAQAGRAPIGSDVLDAADEKAPPGGQLPKYVIKKRVLVGGDSLTDAQGTFQDGMPVVSFRFDAGGARKFGDATRENVGRRFAIVLDNKVISAPVIREPILGGSGIISGNFTVESAKDLAILLRAGALPAPLKAVEQRTVGPGLGADSIHSGTVWGSVGVLLVVLFMLAVYGGRFGLTADIALAVNLMIIVAALSLLQAALTLPGIAGIVLTAGMAVDANVLIFERIREESRLGKTPIAAIDAGFVRAWATIIDSHLTTLIASALMFQFGTGPVRGFAVTLSIGILASLFTAVTFTRLLILLWLRRNRPLTLSL